MLLGVQYKMVKPCRSWWRNCALETDSEIHDIDQLEDLIAPVSPSVWRIRELISSLELCHHKAGHWVNNIIEAIGSGETNKGLGTRSPGQQHPAEKVWQNACAALSAWCAGKPSTAVSLSIDSMPASRFLSSLGERSPLKEWQVQRVVEKIRSLINWPLSCDDPSSQYVWILFGGDEYQFAYLSECPEHYREHKEYWHRTVQTIIHDTVNEHGAEMSLGFAIDMLWPCHWRFVTNLQFVLEAIGGNLHPEQAFAACGRNIDLAPNRERMAVVCTTLQSFCGSFYTEVQTKVQTNKEMDKDILTLLGEQTEEKRWLAASLDKTIRLQLYPSAEMRRLSVLEVPAWIKQMPG